MGIEKNNLSNVLFSKVQQRVLGILYFQPDRSFHTNEIIRLSDCGTGSVQRELAKLYSVGLVTMKLIGNQKHYQANPVNPLFTELRSIILKTFGLADIVKQGLKPFASQILLAFIYGSVAKQEDTANSDIDVLVLSDSISYADLFPYLEKIEAQLGRRINPTCYNPNEWTSKLKANNNFIKQIINQPKIFLIGSADELRKFE